MNNSEPEVYRGGERLFWCNSCESYLPRHTCEWKVLGAVILGVTLVSSALMWGIFSGFF